MTPHPTASQGDVTLDDVVVYIAQRILHVVWVPNCAVGVGTQKASHITKLWQKHMCSNWPKRYQKEFRVGKGLNERLDLVDVTEWFAYELKVSPNNSHFEFYRDIFKVWIHNRTITPPIRKL